MMMMMTDMMVKTKMMMIMKMMMMTTKMIIHPQVKHIEIIQLNKANEILKDFLKIGND